MNFQAELQTLLSLHGLISLLILSLLELVLGVDNIIFISLIVIKLPAEKRFSARVTALSLAFIMRIVMLFCLVWLSRLTATLFTVAGFEVALKDILFFIGGAYLTYNTIKEIISHLRKEDVNDLVKSPKKITYKSIILQIVLVDILFSFDSIFTAIGIIPNFIIMALAVGIGMIFMVYLAGQTSKFIEKYPAVKTLALCFIVGVGLMLIIEAFHLEIPKIYLYAALGMGLIIAGVTTKLKK
ncbi:MAG TPA: TerC family protein [Bacteroidia bacterium]|jgi:predicted tellurium resistance membrane protein TerC|nr:TerC family protein [Bacteroidia bacterium]